MDIRCHVKWSIMASPSPVENQTRVLDLWIETSVVVLVCVAPLLCSSMLAIYFNPSNVQGNWGPRALAAIVRSVGCIALVLFIIWRSHDAPALFGIAKIRVVPDLIGGVGIWALIWLAVHVLWLILPTIIGRLHYLALLQNTFHSDFVAPSGIGGYAVLMAFSLANALSEEIVMRSYLISRLEELLDSGFMAVLLSTVTYACYHGYQGTAAVLAIAISGLISGMIFRKFRRLGMLVVAHTLQDIIALLGFR
jgi:CAAX protease family protein